MEGLFGVMSRLGEGLGVQRTRLTVAAENLANATTTRTPEGGPYRRRVVTVESVPPRGSFGTSFDRALATDGVRVSQIVAADQPPRLVFDPAHPDADGEGFVAYPDIEPVTEMVDIMLASRAYEASSQATRTTRTVIQRALDILR